MNPPPPMLPACGYVTVNARAVAIAASTALPPLWRTCAPIAEAIGQLDTTHPGSSFRCGCGGNRSVVRRGLLIREDPTAVDRPGGNSHSRTTPGPWVQRAPSRA